MYTQVSTLLNIHVYVMKSMDNNNKWLILQMDLAPLLQVQKRPQ
jgi:hypothetical protein